jgi:hypothetical protein
MLDKCLKPGCWTPRDASECPVDGARRALRFRGTNTGGEGAEMLRGHAIGLTKVGGGPTVVGDPDRETRPPFTEWLGCEFCTGGEVSKATAVLWALPTEHSTIEVVCRNPANDFKAADGSCRKTQSEDEAMSVWISRACNKVAIAEP